MWIEPAGFTEVHTRGNAEQHRLKDPSKWVPLASERSRGPRRCTARALPVIEAGDVAAE